MGIERELENLRKRLNRLAPEIVPPKLKMHILGASDEAPKGSAWEMIVRIEPKNPAFNA